MYENIDDGRVVKLRKRHSCEWCGEAIEVGESCILRKYTFDGQFNNSRQHPECNTAMKNSDLGWEKSFEFGQQLRGKTTEETESIRHERFVAEEAARLEEPK
jgi:hypothetical protein